jgi:hypothetical protein
MALSPNYGWAEPDNSSLVKNGAQDIRALGDAIDTSLWNVGFGQAGKNKIINGDFSVNQYGLNSTGVAYGTTCVIDRWIPGASGATGTASLQTFALGTAPVAGYEGRSFFRMATSIGNDNNRAITRIESVRTFAGQTATLSFWAKGTNPTTAGRLNVRLRQYFGEGGTPSADVDTAEQDLVLTANWTRYAFTFNLASIAGKTLGTANNDYLGVDIGQLTNASTESWTLDLWGVQLEYGSKATPFQTASGGSRQAELAMCQRYFEKSYDQATAPATATTTGLFNSTGNLVATTGTIGTGLIYKVTKRTAPSVVFYDSAGNINKCNRILMGTTADTNQAIAAYQIGENNCLAESSGTANRNGIAFHYTLSAEL